MIPLPLNHIYKEKKDLVHYPCPQCHGQIVAGEFQASCKDCGLQIHEKGYLDFCVVDGFSNKRYYICSAVYRRKEEGQFRVSLKGAAVYYKQSLQEAFHLVEKLALLENGSI